MLGRCLPVLLLALTSTLARSDNLQTAVVFLNPMGASADVQNEILGQMKNAGVHVTRTEYQAHRQVY
jgi:hypothetical protein